MPHTITIELEAFYGVDCDCESHDSGETLSMEVDEALLLVLKKMQAHNIPLDHKGVKRALGSRNKVLNADEKALLKALHEEVRQKHQRMVKHYWVFDAYNELESESLKEWMMDDINNGLFEPDESLEEYMDECDYEEDDEEWTVDDYKDHILDDYRDWVYSHDEETELRFIADRVGCSLDTDDTPAEYTITI